MTTITAQQVRELRDQSGAPMMDCKKALAENGGDLVKAGEWLRKKGIQTAAKKGIGAHHPVQESSHPNDNTNRDDQRQDGEHTSQKAGHKSTNQRLDGNAHDFETPSPVDGDSSDFES